MKILVVGGAGYIGGVTTHLLVKSGHEVTVLDNLSSGQKHNLPNQTKLIKADINHPTQLEHALAAQKFDVVMHFAALIQVGESMTKPSLYYQNNVVGSLNLIEAAIKNGVKNFIFSSSAAVYGAPKRNPIAEADPTLPINPYGMSKLMVEQLLKSYELTHGLSWAAFRYFNAAGAYAGVGPDYPNPTHLISRVMLAILKQKSLEIFGNDYPTPDGTCVRDFVHVKDIGAAHMLGALKLAKGEKLNQPLNLGAAQGYSVLEVINAISKVTGQSVPYRIGPRRPGDPPKLVASNSQAKQLLGWQPKSDLLTILTDAWDWYKERA